MSEKQKKNLQTKEESESLDKKSIYPKTAVKGLINGFVSYGILLAFIFLTITVFITWIVENNRSHINYDVLKYTLPLLASFLIFFLIRATCRLSTYDLFKNCKIEENEKEKVCTKMNFFYLCLIVFFIITIIVYLITRFSNEKIQIQRELAFYSQSNSIYAEEKEEELIEAYQEDRCDTLVKTVIVEMGLVLGIFSLIPNQRRLIDRYN